MEFPIPLRTAVESRAATLPQAQLLRDAQALSERYRGGSGSGKRLVTTKYEALAYSVTRMPATFGAVSSALEYALAHTVRLPRTLLDVGAGTGAAAWAADALLELDEVTCLEREDAMRSLGQEFMQSGSESLQAAKWVAGDLVSGPLPGKADLVVASYVLNEVREEDRPAAVEKLWNAAEEMLLLVEPGTPAGFVQLRAARDSLLQQGAQIAAPCPQEGACPIAGEDWCHFACRISRSRLHKQLKGGDAPYEDEKFAFLALVRTDAGRCDARILRHPFVESGKITLELCTAEGLKTVSVRKRDGAAFKRARKAGWGDEF